MIGLSLALGGRSCSGNLDHDPQTSTILAGCTADPAKKINKAVAPFYPNRYFPDTFSVLTYSLK